MADIQELRQKYPQYSDMSDEQFAKGFHDKFYSDLPLDEFASKIGYDTSKVAAFTKSAAESTIPSAAGLASAINLGRGGAMLGGAVAGAPRGRAAAAHRAVSGRDHSDSTRELEGNDRAEGARDPRSLSRRRAGERGAARSQAEDAGVSRRVGHRAPGGE